MSRVRFKILIDKDVEHIQQLIDDIPKRSGTITCSKCGRKLNYEDFPQPYKKKCIRCINKKHCSLM